MGYSGDGLLPEWFELNIHPLTHVEGNIISFHVSVVFHSFLCLSQTSLKFLVNVLTRSDEGVNNFVVSHVGNVVRNYWVWSAIDDFERSQAGAGMERRVVGPLCKCQVSEPA